MMNQKLMLLALLTASSGLLSCGTTDKGSTQNNTVRNIKCDTVTLVANSSQSAQFAGKISAAKESKLSFRVAGVIDDVLVNQGDFVKEGQIIAVMDNRDYQLQYDATVAEYTAVKAEADRVIALYEKNSTTQNNYDKAVNGLKRITIQKQAHLNALEDTKLKAPFSGYVQKTYFDQGEAVSAGLPIVEIISSQTPEVEINVPLNEYKNLDNLISASIQLDGVDTPIELKKLGVAYKANLNQLYTVRFRISSSLKDVKVTPGMSVMVKLNFQGSDSQEVIFPFSAIVEKESKTCVWIMKPDNSIELKEVDIKMITSKGEVVVQSGVEIGEVVITAGVNSLKPGDKVKPMPEVSNSNVGGIL